jgi:hypothetical protein
VSLGDLQVQQQWGVGLNDLQTEDGLYFDRPGWTSRQARPKSEEELCKVLSESPLISTHRGINIDASVPNRVRNVVRRDHLRTALETDISEVGPDDTVGAFITNTRRLLEDELRRVEASPMEDRPVVHLASHIPPEVEVRASDQIVIVRGETQTYFLQKELAQHGLCIPHGANFSRRGVIHSIVYGDTPQRSLDINFPHALEAQCGSWRDWVVEMRLATAAGIIVKAGSKAVKNVAGYDVHKLMIGARATLGIVLEVTLRVMPIKAVPDPDVEVGPAGERCRHEVSNPIRYADEFRIPKWIQRTQPSDFRAAIRAAGEGLLAADHASSTLWALVPAERELERFSGDWVLRSGCGGKNLELSDPTQIRLMKRAKEIFDPTAKLNPGEMGIF